MSGRILVRGGDGALQEFPIRARLNIGSAAPSDVVVDGDGVLPLHATAEIRDQDCWIEAAAGGRIAINGQPVEKRALRHLDVITLGDRVHVIFSTSSAPLPQMQGGRPRKAAAPNPGAPATATRMMSREDVAAASFTPPAEDAPPAATNTIVGVPIATFAPPGAPPPANTIIGPRAGITPPAFAPDLPPTVTFPAPAATPFTPEDARVIDAVGPNSITGVRLRGNAGVFDAPLGTWVIGRGSKATLRIDSKEVSRVHAVLVASADGVTIEDQGSVNGTSLNGVRLTGKQVLAEGDLVSLGLIDLRVELVRPEK